MDLSSSLDVLVSRDRLPRGEGGKPDPMANVIRTTQEKMQAAFRGGTKVAERAK